MDSESFLKASEKNEVVADYLDAIAQEAAPATPTRSVGLDFLFIIAGTALLKLVQHNLNGRRALEEVTLRRMMEDEIDHFVTKGYTKAEATKAVLAVSKAVSTNPPDDNILRAGIALLTGKTKS